MKRRRRLHPPAPARGHPEPLAVGTPVRIRRDDLNHDGWRGEVCEVDRWGWGHTVLLTHDASGDRLWYKHRAGPFVRAELVIEHQPPRPDPSPSRAA